MWTAALKTCLPFWMLFSSSEAQVRSDICPTGWSCNYESYYKYIPSPKTWVEAEIYCQGLLPGAHLASVHSLQENTYIKDVVFASDRSNPRFWIGGSDCYKDRTFMWVDGTVWDYQSWYQGEPNNSGGREPCLHVNLGQPGMWNDEKCATAMAFVCKVYDPLRYIG